MRISDSSSDVCSSDLGTVTAIVGRSGSGKSTLVKLIPRFYEIESGQILPDGQPLRDYRLADLRRPIALVGQQVIPLHASVAANAPSGDMAGGDPTTPARDERGLNPVDSPQQPPPGTTEAVRPPTGT